MNIIEQAIKEDDFNTAVKVIQDALRVDSGDFAGIHFSNYDTIEENWPTINRAQRFGFLRLYATQEIQSWLS